MSYRDAAYPFFLAPGLTYPSQPVSSPVAPDGYEWTEATPGNWVLTAVSHFKDSRTSGDIYEPFNRPSAW